MTRSTDVSDEEREDIVHRLFTHMEAVVSDKGAMVRCYRTAPLGEELAAVVRFQRDIQEPYPEVVGAAGEDGAGGLTRAIELWLPFDDFPRFVSVLGLPGPYRLYANEPSKTWGLIAGVRLGDGIGGEIVVRTEELVNDVTKAAPEE